MNRYDYIIHRIAAAKFESDPFQHLYIEDLFTEADFEEIVRSPEVDIRPVDTDKQLVDELYSLGFGEISFPGTTTDVVKYLEWHRDRHRQQGVNNANCEGFGVTMRLKKFAAGSVLQQVDAFFRSPPFWTALATKFGIALADCRSDFGLQKYLDGYEISPHPDIRRKALTLMANINPSPTSEQLSIHTHYMRFRPEHRHVQDAWSTDLHIDRTWVPWEWCETVKSQTRNNSIVIFSPSDDTLHAVKADYNHLTTQRTQFYGNLWYKEDPTAAARARRALT